MDADRTRLPLRDGLRPPLRVRSSQTSPWLVFTPLRVAVAHPRTDATASARFYVDVVGCTLEVAQGEQFVWLTSGGLTLLLRPGFESAPASDLAGIHLVLYTDDVEAARQRLRAAGVDWSERANCVHFRDPDGHWLQIVDPTADHSV